MFVCVSKCLSFSFFLSLVVAVAVVVWMSVAAAAATGEHKTHFKDPPSTHTHTSWTGCAVSKILVTFSPPFPRRTFVPILEHDSSSSTCVCWLNEMSFSLFAPFFCNSNVATTTTTTSDPRPRLCRAWNALLSYSSCDCVCLYVCVCVRERERDAN